MFEINIGNGLPHLMEIDVLNSDEYVSWMKLYECMEKLVSLLVENGGYIKIKNFTNIISADGMASRLTYYTYITYLQESKNNGKINLSNSSGEVMLEFNDDINSQDFYVNFQNEEKYSEKMLGLLIYQCILKREALLNKTDSNSLRMLRDRLLGSSVNYHK